MRKFAHILVGVLILLVIIKYAHSCEKQPYLVLTGCTINSNLVSQTNRNTDGSYAISAIRPSFNNAVITNSIEDITIRVFIENHSCVDAGYFYLWATIEYQNGLSEDFKQLEYGIPAGQSSYKEMLIDKVEYLKVNCIKFYLSF